jgi:predicted dehydrogenase
MLTTKGHRNPSKTILTRREAIGCVAGAAAVIAGVPRIVPSRVLGTESPSKRITIGCIGVGNEGFGHNTKAFLVEPDAQIVAVCDVLAQHRKRAKEAVDARYSNKDCREYADFREVLARKDIDAVMIGTPDHWHVPLSLMALEAGKDVFCEKPTLTIAEGRVLVDAVARHKAVFQVGLEDRSIIYYHKMAELARNGALGKLQAIHAKLPGGTILPIEQPVPPPPELNWDLWLGPAPLRPYTATITQPMHWRQVRDFSGGLFTDWGSHLLDTAQVAVSAEQSGPVEVEGEGECPKNSMSTTFVAFKVHYRYASGVELFVESGGTALRIEGSDGWVGNNRWRGPLEASSQDLLRQKFPAETNKIWPLPPYEHRNFLDCVKSRKPTTYTAEAGHRLSTVMHIGNIAMTLGRKLKWDPQSESFPGDEAANSLRSRPLRDDWKK